MEADDKSNVMSKKQKLTAVALNIPFFLQGWVFAMLGTFFTKKAQSKGLTVKEVGTIFGMLPITAIVGSWLMGCTLLCCSPRNMILASSLVTCIVLIPFSFVMHLQIKLQFYAVCLIIRIIQGLSYSGIQTGLRKILTTNLKAYLATITGLMEMSFTAGIATGALVSGLLFDKFGFKAPFLFGSLINFIFLIVLYFILDREERKEDEDAVVDRKPATQYLRIAEIIFPLMASMFVVMNESFFDLALSPFLQDRFGVTPAFCGFCIMTFMIVKSVTTPLFGWIVDKKGYHEILVIGGCIILSFSLAFTAPAPFFKLKPSLIYLFMSLILGGVGSAMAFVSVIAFTFKIIDRKHIQLSDQLSSFVSTCINFFLNTGTASGPIVGGYFVDIVGFPWTSVIFAGLSLVAGLLITINILLFCCKTSRSQYQTV